MLEVDSCSDEQPQAALFAFLTCKHHSCQAGGAIAVTILRRLLHTSIHAQLDSCAGFSQCLQAIFITLYDYL